MPAIQIKALRIRQPIGEFYVGVITPHQLLEISFVDMRRLETELDSYIGIQRRLDPNRVKEISAYVRTFDATFPTSIIIAVDDERVEFDEENSTLRIFADTDEEFRTIAKILDGQHRLEGFRNVSFDRNVGFDLNISIFVGSDLATQANIFAIVNKAQTKVNRSLVYDLLDYEKLRSPHKSAHHIAVALDSHDRSALYRRIKRLGVATPGFSKETITQATFVDALLRYLSRDPQQDREKSNKNIAFASASDIESRNLIFRNLWIDGRDKDIGNILFRYFLAVKRKWPVAWDATQARGNILPRTNGFRALMRFLRPVYLKILDHEGMEIPSTDNFSTIFKEIDLSDSYFDVENFPPGTSGESKLFKLLIEKSGLAESK